jgi:hypothetical protein
MSTAPANTPVDEAVADWITDLAPARVWMLAEMQQRQHALATEWGGPGCWVGMNADESDTVTVLARVPPGVEEMDLTLLCSGLGDVTVTCTTIDAVGTRLIWLMPGDTLGEAWPVSTVGELDSGLGANSGRAVTVSSSVVWAWATVRLVFTIASGGPGTIHGVMLRPIHKAR